MEKKKVLVLGASGFIGKNIYEHLKKNEDLEVHGTRFNKYIPNLTQTDLTDHWQVGNLMAQGFDVVIQAAAATDGSLSYRLSPERYIKTNVEINQTVLSAVAEAKIGQFIFLSCSVMYPSHPWAQKEYEVTNLHETHPAYFLGASMKMYVENLCEHYSRKGKTKFTVIRHSNCYGPYDKFSVKGHVLSATIDKVMRSDGEIDVWGDGMESRDFLHVSDLVKFIELAINRPDLPAYDLVNLGGGELISIRELVKKIISTSGKRVFPNFDKSKETIDSQILLDTTHAQKAYGWQKTISLDQGLRETIDWYQANVKE